MEQEVDIFAINPWEQSPVETFGGYRIWGHALPEGYGKTVGDPDFIGSYRTVRNFFESLSPEELVSYVTIAEFASKPAPEQDTMHFGIYGFNVEDFAIHLASGVSQYDPAGKHQEIRGEFVKKLQDLRFWHQIQHNSQQRPAPTLKWLNPLNDSPNTADWFWDWKIVNRRPSKEQIETESKFIDDALAYANDPSKPNDIIPHLTIDS